MDNKHRIIIRRSWEHVCCWNVVRYIIFRVVLDYFRYLLDLIPFVCIAKEMRFQPARFFLIENSSFFPRGLPIVSVSQIHSFIRFEPLRLVSIQNEPILEWIENCNFVRAFVFLRTCTTPTRDKKSKSNTHIKWSSDSSWDFNCF